MKSTHFGGFHSVNPVNPENPDSDKKKTKPPRQRLFKHHAE